MRGLALQAARRGGSGVAAHWRRRSDHAAAAAAAAPVARHPLADGAVSLGLRRRADEIAAAFDAIEPALRDLAPRQFEPDFPQRARALVRDRLQIELPADAFAASWTAPLDARALHARCVIDTFCRLVERSFDRDLAALDDGEPTEALIRRWGFHAIDVTPCADGRLSGVIDYILRVPPAVVTSRTSYAGAMFDVEAAVRQWEGVELRRWRERLPNAADAPTRYLKIGVYHFSSVDPQQGGCAAHGSDDARAAAALAGRLDDFAQAVRRTHGAEVATMLVGVDTDTDAVRVHVPDAHGRTDVSRHVDARALYDATREMAREAAKDEIRAAVAGCAGLAADDPATEGVRWLCGYVLKNNIGQVDAVRDWHAGRYQDAGHRERLIVVGDAIDDVQLRNLAFQAQMETVEEGAADLDVGVAVLRGTHEPRGLPIPLLAHFRYDPRVPGAEARAQAKALRLTAAILSRHADLAARGLLQARAFVRSGGAAPLQPVEADLATEPRR